MTRISVESVEGAAARIVTHNDDTTAHPDIRALISGGGGSVTSVAGRIGVVVLDKNDVGLSAVTNTSDANKPVSSAQQAAFNLKADLVSGFIPDGQIPAGIARDSEVAAAVAALVNSAPGTLDTLGEIATALQADESTAAALATTVGGKAAKSANLSDLASAPTARTNLGLGSVDNTADSAKPVSTAQATYATSRAVALAIVLGS